MTTTASERKAGELTRSVGFYGLLFVSLGSIIGSGWLLGALTAAETAGPASILSWILDSVPQVDWLHPWLIVDKWLAFADLLRDPPYWDNVLIGLGVNAAYAVVFWQLACARFAGKDLTS